jgi:hypothetical protein
LGDGAGDHGRCCGTYLTGMHVKKTEGADLTNGISMDQIVAQHYAELTQIPSLEMGLEPPSLVGSCDTGYSCAYTNTLSWSNATTPLPVTVNPREVFERLFGDGDSLDAKTRMMRLKRQASILDLVADDARRLSSNMGATDKRKLDEYLTVGARHRAPHPEARTGRRRGAMPNYTRPAGIPDNFAEHAQMMIDMMVLAAQADLTRVNTLMLAREVSNRSYPEIGVPDAHHPMSHHGNDPEKLAKLTKINTLHMEQVAYYLKRMSETKDGTGTLLDNTLLLAGASLADPNKHSHRDLPTIVAGGMTTKGNRHLQAAKGTPMTNLMLSMMDQLDVKVDKLGDSTGRLTGLWRKQQAEDT